MLPPTPISIGSYAMRLVARRRQMGCTLTTLTVIVQITERKICGGSRLRTIAPFEIKGAARSTATHG
jgi:hypothetical protein